MKNTRRDFLKKTSLAGAGIVGTSVISCKRIAENDKPSSPATSPAESIFSFTPTGKTKVFTIFTSAGCGCTGSGGAPKTATTHEQVLSALQLECNGVDFIRWEGNLRTANEEMQKNKDSYDGILIIGMMNGDQGLAFTGLPTIVVYNLWEFISGQPWYLFATGKVPEGSILTGGTDYKDVKILNAQLDRRTLCAPAVRESMFKDLVYKIKMIQIVRELKDIRVLMIAAQENIAEVNFRGDRNETFPEFHNLRYIQNLKELLGVEIVRREVKEFQDMYQIIDIKEAEKIADNWIKGAQKVEVARAEIVKNARAYLALDALREKFNCNAVSTHGVRYTASGQPGDRYNPNLGIELGFKPRGIMAVCQNYPDLVLSEILAYKMTGRLSMMGDFIYDIDNSLEIVLHCGIPINPYGDDRRVPYNIRPHAQSPVRDKPEEPGASTGMTAEWPVGEPVTIWEIHSLNKTIRLHTGEIVDGHAIYTGGEDIYNVMCTAKIIAKCDIKKIRDQYMPNHYGIHTIATIGDLRQLLKDIAVLIGFKTDESDR